MVDYFSLDQRAGRLLSHGSPEEALLLVETELSEDASNVALLRLKARALHALDRHADEIAFLDSAPNAALEDTEVEMVRELAEDLGKSRKGEGVRAVLEKRRPRFSAAVGGKILRRSRLGPLRTTNTRSGAMPPRSTAMRR